MVWNHCMISHTFVVRSVMRGGKASKSSSIMHLLNTHRYVFHENTTFHENAIFHENANEHVIQTQCQNSAN